MSRDFEELRALADDRCDETIDDAGRVRLEELLLHDAEAQDWFIGYVDLHASLQWARREPALPRRQSSALRLAAGLAAGFLLAALLLTAGNRADGSAARVARTENVEWETPPASASLVPGPYSLRRGLAELSFAAGVVVTIEGPCDIEIRGPKRMSVRRGKALCRVPASGIGFVLETPNADVVDLGTEFGVAVGDQGGTDLQVNEGEVRADLRSGSTQRLLGGQALRLGGAADAPREVPFEPYRFVRILPYPEDPAGRGSLPYNAPSLDHVRILPAPAGVTIDGDLSDWDLKGRFRTACDPPFEAYSLEGAMMYDDRCLYVAAVVADPFPMRSQISPAIRSDIYGRGGSVALRLATDRKTGWPVRGLHEDLRKGRAATPEDVSDQLTFAVIWYYAPEDRACIYLRHGMDFHGVRVNPPGYRGAFRKLPGGNGYVMESAIPWELLHAQNDPPRGGDVLGATWLVHWSDAAGKTWKGQLIDVVNPAEKGWNFHNAGTWGRAIYEPRSK